MLYPWVNEEVACLASPFFSQYMLEILEHLQYCWMQVNTHFQIKMFCFISVCM